MIYVQHLLGIGHLQRSAYLATELVREDFEVQLVSGGLPQQFPLDEAIQLRQLPPVYSPDGSFTRLLDANGNHIDSHWQDGRKQQLLEFFVSFAPQVLITETFPFGRRMMRFELIPLLEAAKSSTRCLQVIASIRDIIQPKTKPGREQEICELIDQFYDHVLVHGDEKIARLVDSFNLAEHIDDKVAYSGYICPNNPVLPSAQDGIDEVLVSAGGSVTGFQILKTAIEARPLCRLKHLKWRILVSHSISDSLFEELQQLATEGIRVERNRPDFSELVKRASLSISQAGYNTITDILNSDTEAVVIPYAEADELEQTTRAQKLQDIGRVIMLRQAELNATALADAIDRTSGLHTSFTVNLAGATNSANLISQWLLDASNQN
ncbi:MAG: glycosyltransferase [Gammaproteobacteria bacterium]|nr:glycosyltransferase [Gammaproteobacteria bacterium]